MALLKVLTAPDPRLKVKAEPVSQVDDRLRTVMDDMLETMYVDDGVGLAATQVGIDLRIIVINLEYNDQEKNQGQPYRIVNPEILWHSEETLLHKEGCLSIPGFWPEVRRFTEVKVGYMDENNQPQTLEADGLMAICLQHEIDHLNGILSIDHISRLKRDLIITRLKKHKNRT
jgi:peptide deformylase